MKYIRYSIVFIFIMALLMAGCSAPAIAPTEVMEEVQTATETVSIPTEETVPTEAPTAAPEESAETSEPEDYFPDKAVIEYATGFTVEYFSNYKLVTVTRPWDYAEETFQYVLVQRGTEAPTQYGDTPIIEVPIRSIVPLSTTFLPFIDMLGQLDTVIAVSDATYVTNPAILEMAENSLPSVGYGPGIDVESLIDLEPDVIMATGYGFPEYDTHPVLIQAGLTTVINGDYMDTTPLGRAEWGKFIAFFYNEEKAATEFFNQTVEKYNQVKAMAASVETMPTVFLNSSYEGTWYVPGGQSYMAIFIADAGGDYLWKDDPGTGSLYLSFEEVYDIAAENGEIWLNPDGYVFTTDDLLAMDERYADFAAFQNNAIYNNTKIMSAMGGNDFFESGTAYPELILADLFAIFHPELMPDHEFSYYMHLTPAE